MLRNLERRLSDNSVEMPEELEFEARIFGMVHDEKWEVRKALAGVLAELRYLPETKVDIALSILSEDRQPFVRNAATRARKLRKQRSRLLFVQHVCERSYIEDPLFESIVSQVRGTGGGNLPVSKVYEIAREFGDRSYSELAADTAHEVRSLITPLEGGLVHLREHLKNCARPSDVALGYVVDALSQLDLMKALVDNLQVYGVSQIGPFQVARLAPLLNDAVNFAFLRTKKDRRMVTVSFDVPESMIINMVQTRLARAFGNIVANALQAMEDGGDLGISASYISPEERSILIKISDTGVGMNASQVRQAFRRFSSTRKDVGGTGLGLPIARKIVQQDHGGEIWIESKRGEGTCVFVKLPIDCRSLEL